jgi:hypothetical protein
MTGDGLANVNSWDDGYVSATGTWVIDQNRISDPMNVSTVSCVRNENICYDAQASISSGSFDSYLYSYLERYPATQKISGRRTKRSDADKELCTNIVSDDLRLSLMNGREVVEGLRRESAPTVASLVIGTSFVLLMLAWIWNVVRRN